MKKTIFFSLCALAATFSSGASNLAAYESDDASLELIECNLESIERSHEKPRSTPIRELSHATSTNWSGYVAGVDITSTPVEDTVASVTAEWYVPELTSTGKTETYSAIWVGIDGYGSSTVEQIGTEQDWNGKEQSNYAWYQMYPSPTHEIVDFPVNAGDHIYAIVSYQGDDKFLLQIQNLTTGKLFKTTQTSTTAKRSSAEWVVEAPDAGDGDIVPLANFGTVEFTNCIAAINGTNGPINDTGDDRSYTSITLKNNSTGLIEAVPSGLSDGGQDFSVTWESDGLN